MEFLFFSKEATLETDEVVKLFEASDNLDEIKKTVTNAKDRLFVAWDTVDVTDNAKENIPIDKELLKNYEIKVKERGGVIQLRHTNANVGKSLGYKLMTHPETGKKGILTLNKIYDHYPNDNMVWDMIKKGIMKGVSLGGQAMYKESVFDGAKSFVTKLVGVKPMETSVTEKPCNPFSLIPSFSLFAKSDSMTTEEVAQALGIDFDKVSKEEFEKGLKVEREHDDITNGDPIMIGKIALAHLKEKGDYYTRLESVEKMIEVQKPFGDWKDFDACVADMKSKDYSEESAKKICGSLKAKLEKSDFELIEKEIIGKYELEKSLENRIEKLEKDFT